MAVSHVKSNTVADWTGTVTVGNSNGATLTIAATDLVRPTDWNSAHNQFYTLQGNTNNASTVSGTNVVFEGLGGVTLRGSGSTIGISGAAGGGATVSYFNPRDGFEMIAGQQGQGTFHVQPATMPNVTFDRVCVPLIFSNSSNASGSQTLSLWYGVYTRDNKTLSLLSSTSYTTGITASGTVGAYSSYGGHRIVTIGLSGSLSEGQYWIGIGSQTTSGGANASFSQMLNTQINTSFSGIFGETSNASHQYILGLGQFSASTTAVPGSIAFSQLRGTAVNAQRPPHVYLALSTA